MAFELAPYDARQNTPADRFLFKILHTGCVLTLGNFKRTAVLQALFYDCVCTTKRMSFTRWGEEWGKRQSSDTEHLQFVYLQIYQTGVNPHILEAESSK